jgi:hypothetical protein
MTNIRPKSATTPADQQPTWAALVEETLLSCESAKATTPELYAKLQNHPKAKGNPNFKAKIRQTLQVLESERIVERLDRGLWHVRHVE